VLDVETKEKSTSGGFVPVVGIGSSAGGLEALRDLFSTAVLPTGLAFVVVQHLDPHHESMLAQLIARHTSLKVLQCEGGELLEAEFVYIIPPGHGLSIREGRLELAPFTQPRGLRRPIDDFFISLANDQHAKAACVILSGTGADGTTGLRAVKENGGLCVVQEPETAKYDGMPTSAVSTGLVDYIRAPSEILDCLNQFFFRRTAGTNADQASLIADHIDDLCRVLRSAIGHDFSNYKRSTVIRRVERRMHVLGIDKAAAYLQRIKEDNQECEALFRDLLINVTNFFRDKAAFDVLVDKALVPLLREAERSEDEIRVWVPGCSSGEEAYSIAMLFADAAKALNVNCNVQIFATDIDESMLQIARDGIYPLAGLADIPLNFQEQFLIPQKDRFTFNSAIRGMIRFSAHSLIKDPPFSKVDLVSCRNLLIYFDDKLQQTVMPLLHYALRPGGFLFLGTSESVGRFDKLFSGIDQKTRLFERMPGSPAYPIPLPASNRREPTRREAPLVVPPRTRADESVAVNKIVDRYVPACLVLDTDGQIVAAYGPLSRFLEFPVSRSNETSATALARPGIKENIGPLLRQAGKAGRRVVARDVDVVTDFGTLPVDIICDPLLDGTLLFVFQEKGKLAVPLESDLIDLEPGDGHVEALESELRFTKHRLRTAIEELETANEELKSSNEEMMSMNEELQSTNEELTTVNDELKGKIDQVTTANSDLRNFFESTSLAVVVLDKNVRIRSFTQAATSLFPLQLSDKGRPFSDVASHVLDFDYVTNVRKVMAEGRDAFETVPDRTHSRTFTLRILPYRTSDGTIDGATIVLTDITQALDVQNELVSEQERLDLAVHSAGIGVWEFLPEDDSIALNSTMRDFFGFRAENVKFEEFLSAIPQSRRQEVAEAVRMASNTHKGFDLTLKLEPTASITRWLKVFARPVTHRRRGRVMGVCVDVTAENDRAESRDLMLGEMNHRVKNLFAMIAGIMRVAARNHTSVSSFVANMESRILALGQAHSLATRQDRDDGVSLDELLKVILAPYSQQSSIATQGPSFTVRQEFITPITLILHEWATNAVKHGVLGAVDGQLSVQWEADTASLVLTWAEHREVEVGQLDRQGFGTVLLSTAARQLRATLDTDGDGHTLRHRLKMPISLGDYE